MNKYNVNYLVELKKHNRKTAVHNNLGYDRILIIAIGTHEHTGTAQYHYVGISKGIKVLGLVFGEDSCILDECYDVV